MFEAQRYSGPRAIRAALASAQEKIQKLGDINRALSLKTSKLRREVDDLAANLADARLVIAAQRKEIKALKEGFRGDASFIKKQMEEMAVAAKMSCPICYEEYLSSGERLPVMLERCAHQVCADCFAKLLQQEMTCPICRKAIEGPSKILQLQALLWAEPWG